MRRVVFKVWERSNVVNSRSKAFLVRIDLVLFKRLGLDFENKKAKFG